MHGKGTDFVANESQDKQYRVIYLLKKGNLLIVIQ